MPGIDDLYREIILDHYRSPRNRGELPSPPATRAEGFNPLCGDEIVIYIDVDDAGVITDIAIGGQGCSISQSSASMMSTVVKGHTISDARQLIHAFKSMMSIHEDSLSGESNHSHEDVPHQDVVLDDGTPMKLGDLEALEGVVKFPVRIKCATLSWNTLAQALDEALPEEASSES